MKVYWVLLLVPLALGYHIDLRDVPNSCVKCHETDPNKINVHLVHHSHDDVGWLKTLDQYYWGLNYSITNVGVQYIISSVVDALEKNPDRRFIQVETAFFWKWWLHQDEDTRSKFKTLVENGQLEIINGGWSMNDEGCVNYQSTIDQFTWGFRILNETLGECGYPTFGWQIDPFGHSREHASLLWRMGFDGLVFSRLDHHDRDKRKSEANMEYLWRSSANDDDSDIFGAITPDDIYYPPSGFCFDILCEDDSLVDDPTEDTYNIFTKAEDFGQRMKTYATWFKTNNVLITMGGDFQFQDAEKNFINSDRLIKAFENNDEVNLIYSTPSCYLKAVYESQPSLESKTDDFFPYGNSDHSYWAGYFTSRQNYKRFERISRNVLQVAKQLNSLALSTSERDIADSSLKNLREAIGVAQHHDSITGTAKQHVSNDYTKLLARGVSGAEASFSSLLGKLINVELKDVTSCILANMSICAVSQNSDEFLVVAYNPLAWPVDYPIRLPVETGSFTVIEDEGEVTSEVLTPISDFAYVDLENAKPAKKELVFVASQIPPLGIKSFLVKKSDSVPVTLKSNTYKFGTDELGFEIDETSNLLKSVTVNGQTIQITQEFMHYTSDNGTDDSEPSGAYLFRPDGVAIPFDNPIILSSTQGTVVDEVHQRVNNWITQIIRAYKGSNYIEFDWLVGPLDVSNENGIEIISRFTVTEEFNNDKTFYTDSNGREMIERKVDFRPTYSYDTSIEPVASNYYPVTAKISIKDTDKKLQVSVLNDRSQAGASLDNGQLELMVHRRCLYDDLKGVGEPINETEFEQGIVARGQHYLIVGSSVDLTENEQSLTAQERILAHKKLLQPWVGLADAKVLGENVQTVLNAKYSALKSSLPENVNLLTLEPWTGSSYILRLEHIFEKNEDPELSGSVTVDLDTLFADFKVTQVEEMTLGANRKLAGFKTKYDWKYSGKYKEAKTSLSGTKVTLGPMDIKTFIIEMSK